MKLYEKQPFAGGSRRGLHAQHSHPPHQSGRVLHTSDPHGIFFDAAHPACLEVPSEVDGIGIAGHVFRLGAVRSEGSSVFVEFRSSTTCDIEEGRESIGVFLREKRLALATRTRRARGWSTIPPFGNQRSLRSLRRILVYRWRATLLFTPRRHRFAWSSTMRRSSAFAPTRWTQGRCRWTVHSASTAWTATCT